LFYVGLALEQVDGAARQPREIQERAAVRKHLGLVVCFIIRFSLYLQSNELALFQNA
jgi:hypothetical protein